MCHTIAELMLTSKLMSVTVCSMLFALLNLQAFILAMKMDVLLRGQGLRSN